MPFTRPPLQVLIDRVKGDIKDALGLVAVLRRSLEGALAIALAGASHVLHGHMRFLSKQIFPDTAEEEYMIRHAAVYQLSLKPATFAKFEVEITGSEGSVAPISTIYQRQDGATYTSQASGTIASGVATLTLISDVEGADYNLIVGEQISLQSPISGIDTIATVTSVIIEAEDTETIESLRERTLARIRNPPSGGTVNDYLTYAREVAGVTRAWILPNWPAAGYFGEGGVGISFVVDASDPIIPSPAKVLEVQTNVDLNKPITADAVVFAPVANEIDFTINIKPNTSEVRAAVTGELTDLFAREGQVAGAVDPDLLASAVTYSGGLAISKIDEAISVADGEDEHALLSPTTDIVSANGQIITLGTITFGTLA